MYVAYYYNNVSMSMKQVFFILIVQGIAQVSFGYNKYTWVLEEVSVRVETVLKSWSNLVDKYDSL